LLEIELRLIRAVALINRTQQLNNPSMVKG